MEWRLIMEAFATAIRHLTIDVLAVTVWYLIGEGYED